MTITAAHVASGNVASGTTVTLSGVTLTAGKLYILTVAGFIFVTDWDDGDMGVTGTGQTWTEIARKHNDDSGGGVDTDPTHGITQFRFMPTTTLTGASVQFFEFTNNGIFEVSLDEYSGVLTTGTNGANAIVQVASNACGTGPTSLSVPLATFASGSNMTVATFGDSGATRTVGSGFTSLYSAATVWDLLVETKAGQDLTADYSWTETDVDAVGIALELAAAGGNDATALPAAFTITTTHNTPTASAGSATPPAFTVTVAPNTPSAAGTSGEARAGTGIVRGGIVPRGVGTVTGTSGNVNVEAQTFTVTVTRNAPVGGASSALSAFSITVVLNATSSGEARSGIGLVRGGIVPRGTGTQTTGAVETHSGTGLIQLALAADGIGIATGGGPTTPSGSARVLIGLTARGIGTSSLGAADDFSRGATIHIGLSASVDAQVDEFASTNGANIYVALSAAAIGVVAFVDPGTPGTPGSAPEPTHPVLFSPSPLRRFMVADIVDGTIRSLDMPFDQYRYTDTLNRPGSFQATLPLTSPYADEYLLAPWRTAIYVVSDLRVEWGGILIPPSMSTGSNQLSVSAIGWLGYWDHRYIRTDYVPVQVDQFDIFAQLIADAQDEGVFGSGYDLDIDVTWDALSGVLRDRTDDYRPWKSKSLGEAIRQLAAVDDGFDYAMQYTVNTGSDRVDKAIKLYYPTKGRDTDFVFEYIRNEETNVIARGFADNTDLSWVGDGWGSGTDELRLVSPYVDETARGVYPPLDGAPSWSEVTVQETLDEQTEGEFDRTRRPKRVPILRLDPHKSPMWGEYVVGDIVHVRIDDGYGSTGVTPEPHRITGVTITEDSIDIVLDEETS